MNTIVTETGSDENTRWTPNREGLVFNEFISTWKEGDYEVDDTLIKKVSNEASQILSKCVDPKNINLEKNSSTGLVIGQVQSGKTLSMTAVTAMAKDNGFGIVIVMSGNVTTLSSQTAERFEQALEGRNTIKIKNNPENTWSLEDNLSNAKAVIENFNETINPEDRSTLLIITHKNPARINNISELFESIGTLKDNIPTLIIDDEADHHSLNSKEFLNDVNNLSERRKRTIREIHEVTEGETFESIAENFSTTVEELKEINNIENLPQIGSFILTEYIQTITHSSITDLKSNFKFNTYLGYTATPQAISLIPRVNQLSPEFVHVINTGEGYTGLDFFFPKDKNNNPICSNHIIDVEEENEYSRLVSDGEIPPSLDKAISFFIFGVAIGVLNKDHNNKKKNRSMIIHPHHLVDKHKDFYDFTVGSLETLKNGLKNKDDVAYPETIKKLEKAYKIFSNKFPDANYPKFDEDFIFIIEKAIGLIKPNIKLFNAGRGRSRIPTQIWSQAYARILIGGFGLDRGYTIKGLTITYLSRDKARQDDTLLQRARFFGYHKNYHQFVRVFLSRSSQEYYKEISEINTNFLGSVKKFQDTGKNFKDWPREWWGTNAADHELTRPGVMRDVTLKRFRGDKVITNKYSHLLSNEELRSNQKIYNDIHKKAQNSLIQINHLPELKANHKIWTGNRDILISDVFNIEDLYENYFKHISFHEYEKTKFDVVKQNLATYSRKFGNRPFPVMFLYTNHADEDRDRSIQKNDSINPFRGRDKKNPAGFPGDTVLHYDFLVGATNENVGIDNLTLKINLFDNITKAGKNIRTSVPYFHFVPSIKNWKDYIKGIYK